MKLLRICLLLGSIAALGLVSMAAPPTQPAGLDATEAGVQDQVISWEKAGDYIGQKVTVTGTIVRTHDSGKATFLNFATDWKGTFSAVIFASLACDFPEAPATMLLNKEVRISGKVKNYKGSPEIVIERVSQLAWADGTPVMVGLDSTPRAAMVTAAAAEGVRVVSWNIENFFDELDDPFTNDEVTNPSFVAPERQQRVSDAIHAMNPDVLCLQEVENRALLEKFNNAYLSDLGYQVVLFEGNDKRGIDVALLSRLPIESVTSYRHLRFQDAEGREQKFRRDLLRVRIGGKLNADAYIVHLKSQHGGKNADVIRTSEARAAANIIAAEMAVDADYRGFICGDFNEVPEEATIQEFVKIGLIDSCAGTDKYTYNKKPYLTRIDFAFFTPGLAGELVSGAVVDDIQGVSLKCASDHYPVKVELSSGAAVIEQVVPTVPLKQ
ncbi:MAG: endonuclease/exonuclease/phosphatase family protein [Planctomycetota bacterium]|jgi:exonuclease III|nr:endonuclease/exonuclease/phosphatase family protein [Planctomycetota bacterium]